MAKAGEDLTAVVSTEVEFDGKDSFDKNGKPFTYEWSIQTKPATSSAVLVSPSSQKATLKPDKEGIYVIRLTLRQNSLSVTDDVILQVTTDNSGDQTAVIISEHIHEETVLSDIFADPAVADYIVSSDINVRGDLTIEPGVTIFFQEHTSLKIVSGIFISEGTELKPIIFRGVEERAGYWKGILVQSGNPESSIKHSRILHAGSQPLNETGVKAAIVLDGTPVSGASLRLSNSAIASSGGHGLLLHGRSSLGKLEYNTFSNNRGAIYLPASQLATIGEGNVFNGNNFDGVETGGVVDFADTVWPDISPAAYFVSTDITITKGITVEPGAAFKVAGNVKIRIDDRGFLNSSGTADKKIIFTSASTAHLWAGIYINSQSEQNKLIHTEISYGGGLTYPDVAAPANIALGNGGQVHVENSVISNGPGYGLVAKYIYQVNENIASVNEFRNLLQGKILPRVIMFPDRPSLAGDWVDMWTYTQGVESVELDFYDPATGVWFAGATSPWTQTAAGMGIHISADGKFTWSIAEHSPMTGCGSYSAEFIEGTLTFDEETISFHQDYWRSKYVDGCDASANQDIEITPADFAVQYEYDKFHHAQTGEVIWQLRMINPDGSSFSFYRR